jgi:DNA-binding winged helix-turn-helix (wHTH) protein/Tfp pilus assembly protein PilF
MRSYRFGSFILEADERRLIRDGEPVPLTPKVFDTLVYLVEHQGHLVEKDELMQAVWSDSYVEDGNLPRTIHILRRALGKGDDDSKYVETIPTKGYRFVAEVTRLDGTGPSLELPIAAAQVEPEATRDVVRPLRRRTLVLMVASLLLLSFVALGWRIADQVGGSKLRRLMQPTASGAAYTNYQSGRLRLERQYRGDYAEALKNFDTAIKLDPHFAAAYAGKADAEFFLYSDNGTHDDIAQARLAIKRAMELDPNSSYAHLLLCRIWATYDWDFAGAESECRRSVALDPENHEARMELAYLLNSIGKKDDALKEMDTAIALAPTSFNKRSRGKLLYFERRYDEAIAQLKQVEATDPEYTECSRWIARSFEQKKDYAQALEFLIKYRELDGAGPGESALLRRAFATGGWPEVLRTSLPKGQPKANLETAGTFAQLGLKDQAFETLDKMIRDRRLMIVQMDSDPRLDPLRSDPRFEQLAKRVGLR